MNDDPTTKLSPEFQVYRALMQENAALKEQRNMAAQIIRDLADTLPPDLYREWLDEMPDWLRQEVTIP